MAVDIYLELDGVQGESAIKSNAIDIESWSFGMHQQATGHTATGSGAGKVQVQDISIMKHSDKSTPTLMLKLCKGDHITKGKIVVRKAGGQSPVEYIVVDMENILITNFQTSGSNAGDLVSESLTLNFSKFKVAYTPQKAEGGGGAKNEMGWNVSENKSA